ncbi:hypothetical protein BH23BAC3_BH23BAC3_35330 [soil metagenome]
MGPAEERGTSSPAKAGFPLRSNKSQSLPRPFGGALRVTASLPRVGMAMPKEAKLQTLVSRGFGRTV